MFSRLITSSASGRDLGSPLAASRQAARPGLQSATAELDDARFGPIAFRAAGTGNEGAMAAEFRSKDLNVRVPGNLRRKERVEGHDGIVF